MSSHAVRRALLAVIVLLAAAVVVDGLVEAWAERRVAAELSGGLGIRVEVDLRGWPVLPRLLAGSLPGASAASTEASTAPFTLELSDLELPEGLPLGQEPLVLAAPRGRFEAAGLVGTLRDVRLESAGDTGTVAIGALAAAGTDVFEVDRLTIDARGTRVEWGEDGLTLGAARADVEAAGAPIEETDASLRTVALALPDVVARPADGQLLVESPEGTFQAQLGEPAANALWEYPGQIGFGTDGARLSLGAAELVVDVAARDGAILITPQLPSPLRQVLAEVGFAIRPDLPGGAVLEGVDTAPGVLLLRGSAGRLRLP